MINKIEHRIYHAQNVGIPIIVSILIIMNTNKPNQFENVLLQLLAFFHAETGYFQAPLSMKSIYNLGSKVISKVSAFVYCMS